MRSKRSEQKVTLGERETLQVRSGVAAVGLDRVGLGSTSIFGRACSRGGRAGHVARVLTAPELFATAGVAGAQRGVADEGGCWWSISRVVAANCGR